MCVSLSCWPSQQLTAAYSRVWLNAVWKDTSFCPEPSTIQFPLYYNDLQWYPIFSLEHSGVHSSPPSYFSPTTTLWSRLTLRDSERAKVTLWASGFREIWTLVSQAFIWYTTLTLFDIPSASMSCWYLSVLKQKNITNESKNIQSEPNCAFSLPPYSSGEGSLAQPHRLQIFQYCI